MRSALFFLLCWFLCGFCYGNETFLLPEDPLTPPFRPGLLPIALVNRSQLPESRVHVAVIGRNLSGAQCFVQFDAAGVGTLVPATEGDNASHYTCTLPELPAYAGGRVLYVPQINSALVYFSIDHPLNMPVNAPNAIVQPNFTYSPDPNYRTIFDIFEFAYVPGTPNIAADATAVSFFAIPLYGYISTPGSCSAKNSGLHQPRSQIMRQLESCFDSSESSSEWAHLILKDGSRVLRVLSTGKAMTAAQPLFDPNYLDHASQYGSSFLQQIWTGEASFYRSHSLKLKLPCGSRETYTGCVNPDHTITLTSEPSGYKVVFAAPATARNPFTTTQHIFSGEPLHVSDTSPGKADGVQLSKLFEEALVAGLLPTADTLSQEYLAAHQAQYYNANTVLSSLSQSEGPWYDLYSKALHSLGTIYTFAYDEPLWPGVLISSDSCVPNKTFLGITIGPMPDLLE